MKAPLGDCLKLMFVNGVIKVVLMSKARNSETNFVGRKILLVTYVVN